MPLNILQDMSKVINTLDGWGQKTFEGLNNTITQDELDYYLKKKLRVSSEQRYQDKKKNWFFHESSWYSRGTNRYDGCGCNNEMCVLLPITPINLPL
jgi:hypothetical protein